MPENATQYKILPIMLTVLIDQNHVQDLLVELENSPMSIEVRDFELLRPADRIVKPEKDAFYMGGYGMGGMGMMSGMGMRGRGGMVGYGGMSSGMGMMPGMMPGMGMGMGMNSGMGMMPGMGSAMGGMGMGGSSRTGVDKRGTDRAAKRKETEKALDEATKAATLFDPYYNIVEVTVYGQARFYNEPTTEAEESESLGESVTDDEADTDAAVEADEAEGGMEEEATPDAVMPDEAPEADAVTAEDELSLNS